MEAWIEFGRGPLFRLTFGLMVLGSARIFILTLLGIIETHRASEDKIIPWKVLIKHTVTWLIPIGRLWKKRPAYSVISVLFHIGLIIVPLFLAAHVLLWERSVGFAWFTIPQNLANILTILTIVTGLMLFFGRVFHHGARYLSRFQDYIWPPLIVIPFLTGMICSNAPISPKTYQFLMLIHIYSADLIIVSIPFTKVAHCVLMPLSQFVTGVAWKLRKGAGDMVLETLGETDRPTWVLKPRLGPKPVPDAKSEEK